jgi:hypothetical protein
MRDATITTTLREGGECAEAKAAMGPTESRLLEHMHIQICMEGCWTGAEEGDTWSAAILSHMPPRKGHSPKPPDLTWKTGDDKNATANGKGTYGDGSGEVVHMLILLIT